MEDKHTVLLSAAGRETYVLLRNLLAPSTHKGMMFDEIVSNLKTQFELHPLVGYSGQIPFSQEEPVCCRAKVTNYRFQVWGSPR